MTGDVSQWTPHQNVSNNALCQRAQECSSALHTAAHSISRLPNQHTNEQTMSENQNQQESLQGKSLMSNQKPSIQDTPLMSNQNQNLQDVSLMSNQNPSIQDRSLMSNQNPSLQSMSLMSNQNQNLQAMSLMSNQNRSLHAMSLMSNRNPSMQSMSWMPNQNPFLEYKSDENVNQSSALSHFLRKQQMSGNANMDPPCPVLQGIMVDQKSSFETNPFLQELSKISEVIYGGCYHATKSKRSQKEHLKKALAAGVIHIVFKNGISFELDVTPISEEDLSSRNDEIKFESKLIFNGVCVICTGDINMTTLKGSGCLQFDHESAKLEDERVAKLLSYRMFPPRKSSSHGILDVENTDSSSESSPHASFTPSPNNLHSSSNHFSQGSNGSLQYHPTAYQNSQVSYPKYGYFHNNSFSDNSNVNSESFRSMHRRQTHRAQPYDSELCVKTEEDGQYVCNPYNQHQQ